MMMVLATSCRMRVGIFGTRDVSALQVDHLVTYQGDLNLDGYVDDTDLQFLRDAINSGENLSLVDTNSDGIIDFNDFDNVERDQILSQELGEDAFSQVLSRLDGNYNFLFVQGELTWDSTGFTDRAGIDRSDLIADGSLSILVPDDAAASDGNMVNMI